MGLEASLTQELLSAYPSRAAIVLERMGHGPASEFLAGASAEHLSGVAPLLSPQFGAAVLRSLPDDQLARVFEKLPHDIGSRLARQLGDRADAVIALLPTGAGDSLRSLLRYPPNTAGGLMDPLVLAVSDDLTAGDALDAVRGLPGNARYNVYVLDRNDELVGVVNLRELFLAESGAPLRDLMIPNPFFLEAEASRSTIVSHPGWRKAHSIPVVDSQHRYLGAVRYRTLRELEDVLARREGGDTADALGELLAVGATSFVRALTTTSEREGH